VVGLVAFVMMGELYVVDPESVPYSDLGFLRLVHGLNEFHITLYKVYTKYMDSTPNILIHIPSSAWRIIRDQVHVGKILVLKAAEICAIFFFFFFLSLHIHLFPKGSHRL